MLFHASSEEDGTRLRVNVELVEGASGSTFKRESFRIPKQELLSGRDSLARAVAELLRLRLGEEVHLREQRVGTSSLQAWTLVRRVENGLRDAERLAATSDPNGARRRLNE